MKSRILWLVLSCLMVLALVLASCTTGEQEEEEEVEEEEVVEEEEEGPPVGGDWWDKFGEPEYGGTLTLRSSGLDEISFDPGDPRGFHYTIYHERVIGRNWTIDPDICAFKVGIYSEETCAGALAESWERTDPQTIVLHIREGIYWEDKPPVNGRELTAEDVKHLYDRMTGTGSGYTEPNPFMGPAYSMIEQITAPDKYTAVVKFKTPSALAFFQLVGPPCGVGAPEVAQLYGADRSDIRNAVGTGPFSVTEFVRGTSLTFSRNPNYWGYDERHPQNQLPYIDLLKIIAIPDMSTALAAMRTGKVDLQTDAPSLAQAQALSKTNPDIQQHWLPAGGQGINMRCDREPFTDINVRIALQMAIDNEAIAASRYLGTVDGAVSGPVHPEYKGWCAPYDEWPQELKDEYSYNPERARELLAEAGYPGGFSTNCVASSNNDIEVLEIIKSMLMDIGVDMEIKLMDSGSHTAFTYSGKHDQMCTGWGGAGNTWEPWGAPLLYLVSTDRQNTTHNNDAHYDSLYDALFTATSMDEAMAASRDADLYVVQQHWTIYTCPYVRPYLVQPWVKGCNGEVTGSLNVFGGYLARFWIDQELKESMGY